MRLHTASTLDLPVRFLSLSFQYHPSKNESEQQFVRSKDLRTNTLVWSHPQPTLTLLSERCKETPLVHYVTPSFLRAFTSTKHLLQKVQQTQTF